MENVRIDKWLWCVRIFKTRSLSTEACRNNKVRLGDQPVKPSKEVKVGEIYAITKDGVTRTVKVLTLLENRVSAKLVDNYMEDLTPQEEYEKLKLKHAPFFEQRQRGLGRPTKRERRQIDKLKRNDKN